MQIETFYDARTFTLTYVVFDPSTRDAVVIDPVLDYDPIGSKVFTESVDAVDRFLKAHALTLHAVLETHAHADHLSGSQTLKERHPNVVLAIGRRITEVQAVFKKVFDLPDDFATDGRQFDRLVDDGEVFEAGSLRFKLMFTPGHTPACGTWQIDDVIFTGDLIFQPDLGTGRCDFPAGSAADLYRSVTERIFTLPDETRMFVGHDYPPEGRGVMAQTTVGASKARNVQLDGQTTLETFVRNRSTRDATLAAPRLLYQSVQVNIDAGHLPEPGRQETRFLKIPVNVFRPAATHLELGPPA
jgi:glyoxylase-like metal-dependent hydrolase (beta-lactamase superfamily II)